MIRITTSTGSIPRQIEAQLTPNLFLGVRQQPHLIQRSRPAGLIYPHLGQAPMGICVFQVIWPHSGQGWSPHFGFPQPGHFNEVSMLAGLPCGTTKTVDKTLEYTGT
jgi:hypothetical protein